MSNIVVLGSGIGGLPAVFELKDELGEQHDIVLLSGRLAEPFFERYAMGPMAVQKLKDSMQAECGSPG